MLKDNLENNLIGLEATVVDNFDITLTPNKLQFQGKEIFIEGSDHKTIDEFVGFGAKLKSRISDGTRIKMINEAFTGSNGQTTVVTRNGKLSTIVSGPKDLVPLDDIFEVMDNIIPNGDISLFKTDGLTTEFAVTIPEIVGAPTDNRGDKTHGGVYLKANTVNTKPTLMAVPILHRLFCANQISKAQKDSAIKIESELSFKDAMGDLEATVGNFVEADVPVMLKRFLHLHEVYPQKPKVALNYLMNKAKLGAKVKEKVLEELPANMTSGNTSMYDIVNAITWQQHDAKNLGTRNKIWALGVEALSMSVNNEISCTTCSGKI